MLYDKGVPVIDDDEKVPDWYIKVPALNIPSLPDVPDEPELPDVPEEPLVPESADIATKILSLLVNEIVELNKLTGTIQ